jgi:hypothetical protein
MVICGGSVTTDYTKSDLRAFSRQTEVCLKNLPKQVRCENTSNQVRFLVHIATSIKMSVFWDVAPCSLVEIDRRFR